MSNSLIRQVYKQVWLKIHFPRQLVKRSSPGLIRNQGKVELEGREIARGLPCSVRGLRIYIFLMLETQYNIMMKLMNSWVLNGFWWQFAWAQSLILAFISYMILINLFKCREIASLLHKVVMKILQSNILKILRIFFWQSMPVIFLYLLGKSDSQSVFWDQEISISWDC